ncbi:hypothetical protein M501DRAFT_1004071 [Patellaria atrata CBS 101060]|uniref:Zn(2)-C6 fungal-type domain-containing protein n=1 Tax=Patellaria atrata CBS 101060 TaxID=1346257 RepID=A0A9P4SB72_9PEZI|nr:hypothetical protein M501DRAFT_1004071 [Patellaria atrata CBS 101060]
MRHQHSSDRNLTHSRSHPSRDDPRSGPYQVSKQTKSGSSTRDSRKDSTNGTSRRRIPVACQRCRKRKIKCSGDYPDGTGCEHCRSIGEGSLCQFERVGTLKEPAQWRPVTDQFPLHPTLIQGIQQDLTRQASKPSQISSQYELIAGKSNSQYPYTQTYGEHAFQEAYGLNTHAIIPLSDHLNGSTASEDIRRTYGSQSRPQTGFTTQTSPTFYAGNLVQYSSCGNTPVARYSTIGTENVAPFGMASLHLSLPITAGDRQLPAPNIYRGSSSTASSSSRKQSYTGFEGTIGVNIEEDSSTSDYAKGPPLWSAADHTHISDGRHNSVTAINIHAPMVSLSSNGLRNPTTNSSGQPSMIVYNSTISDNPDSYTSPSTSPTYEYNTTSDHSASTLVLSSQVTQTSNMSVLASVATASNDLDSSDNSSNGDTSPTNTNYTTSPLKTIPYRNRNSRSNTESHHRHNIEVVTSSSRDMKSQSSQKAY